MKKYKCINNEETESHVAWGKYFTVGETYTVGKLAKGLEILEIILEDRGDSIVMNTANPENPPFIVPKTHFELVE